MADGLGRILSKPGFDPDNFVHRRAQEGLEELTDMKRQISTLADETAIALKKNVYKNYSQFIETAKEISILESEMYQLSHMLTDQKSIMTGMMEMSITGDKLETPDEPEPAPEDEAQKNLAFLLEKVEGCSSVTEVAGRSLIHDGDLVELDPESLSQINRVHAFLLNDSLMLATWLPQRRGPVKYRFQVLYELDSLAVVNARDVGGCKNAFNILIFPDHRMFQAENPKAKRQWLDILDETKHKKTAADKQRKEAAAAAANIEKARTPSFVNDDSNPFADEFSEDTETDDSRPASVIMETDFLHDDWLQELPEDLDVCIAQRDFEGAVDLVSKVNEHLDGVPKSAAVREYKARVDHRVKQLTDVLVHELKVSPERSLRGGPRAVRRAVTQLVRLGKSAQACELFLSNRSAIFKMNLQQLKLEGATTLYVKRLCKNFFGNLLETGREFLKAFPQNFGCFSSFIVWAEKEVTDFASSFEEQVFANKAKLASVAECVGEARSCCNQLQEIGLDLTFVLDAAVMPKVQGHVKEEIDKLMESIKKRASEDLWRPVNFQNVESLEKFEEQMMEMGLLTIHEYTFDECKSYLTTNTVHFTRGYVELAHNVLRVHCPELHVLISTGLADLLITQVKHADKSIRNPDFKKEHKLILLNTSFIVESVMPLISEKYTDTTGFRLPRSAEATFILQKVRSAAKPTLGEFV